MSEQAKPDVAAMTACAEQRLSVLNPDGVCFDDHITDRAQLSALLDRIVAVIDVYGIQKIGCCVLDDEEGRPRFRPSEAAMFWPSQRTFAPPRAL
jgi:hypothetical protein